jgi:haloalkane dehalogenase
VLEDNVFVERVLPGSVLRKLTDEEMDAYRAPFPTSASRKPVLAFPRDLPIEGQPAEVDSISRHDHEALRRSTYPKLLFYGEPGAIISPEFARNFAAGLANCRAVNLGAGAHYLQEDHPDAIGEVLTGWLAEITAVASAAA